MSKWMLLVVLLCGCSFAQFPEQDFNDQDWRFSSRVVDCNNIGKIYSVDIIMPQYSYIGYNGVYYLDWKVGIRDHYHPDIPQGDAEIVDIEPLYWDYVEPPFRGLYYLEYIPDFYGGYYWSFGLYGLRDITIPKCNLIRIYIRGIVDGECYIYILPFNGATYTDAITIKVGKQYLVGDLNKDYKVNLLDLAIMADNWLK